MSSVVEICNTAIAALGGNLISSLEETTDEAIRCNLVYNNCRKSTLRVHPWNFAVKTKELAQTPSKNRVFRYTYAYQIPADNLRILRVFEDGDYKLESGVIYTNKDTCRIKYIYDNTDVSSYDPLFVEALSAKVQSAIAFSITRDRNDVQLAESLFDKKIMEAKVVDGSEDIEDELAQFDHNLIGARY